MARAGLTSGFADHALLKAELDEDGLALTDADLSASPVVQADYHSGIRGAPEDVTHEALWAGLAPAATRSCSPTSGGSPTVGNYAGPGTVISMTSGDGAEHQVDPTCEAEFVGNP